MGTLTEIRRELELLLRTRTPAVGMQTWEEARALRLARDVARLLSPARDLFVWSEGQGLRHEGQPFSGVPSPCSLREALEAAAEHKGPAIFAFLDPDLEDAHIARRIRDLVGVTGNQPRSLLFIAPHLLLHPTLERTVSLLQVVQPDQQELKNILLTVANRCISVVGVEVQLDGDAPERLADAARGLTAEEAERAFIRALLQAQRLSVAEVGIVLGEKRRVLEREPLLEVLLPEERLEDICGQETLVAWLTRRGKSFTDSTLPSNLPAPRGVLMVGMNGCGRSATVRAIAGSWNLPLVRLRSSLLLQGGREAARDLRRCLEKLELFAPCMLWIPNLDRFFSAGVETDGGRIDSPVASVLLDWLLEKEGAVFVAATAEEHERLPQAIIWKRAFDEVFFVDFPNSEERRQLLGTLLKRREISSQEINLEMLVAASDGFSGVQIDQAVVRGLREAFEQGRALKMVDILQSFRQMTPMASFLGESRRKLKGWAHRRAVPATPSRDG